MIKLLFSRKYPHKARLQIKKPHRSAVFTDLAELQVLRPGITVNLAIA